MEISNIEIKNCIIHRIGNKGREEDLLLSKHELDLDEKTRKQLNQFFLNSFRTDDEINQFTHDIDLQMNEVFVCSSNIVAGEDFEKNSIGIAKHLFNQTMNPTIKNGDLFVTLLTGISVDGEVLRGVGIFKSERKDTFMEVDNVSASQISLRLQKGIAKNKLDKGCIIIGDEFNTGMKVLSYEHNNADADYWRNKFLSIKPKADEYQETKSFFTKYKNYVSTELAENTEITKAQKIDLVNRTVEYFDEKEEFDKVDFERSVLEDESLISSFNSFTSKLMQEDTPIADSFVISKSAVKKQKKSFKSVLKLDKNFHIYVHGNRDLIEHGYDEEKGKRFYKVFFDEEL